MRSDHAERVAIGAATAFLLLHVWIGLSGVSGVWGADMLRYLPRGWLVATMALAAALALLGVRKGDAGIRTTRGPREGRRGALTLAISTVVIVGLALVALRARTCLLGDGLTYLDQLALSAAGGGAQVEREPLAFWLVRQVYRTMPAGPGAGWAAYATVSILSGVIYTTLALAAANRWAADMRGRIVFLGFVMSAGAVVLFAGYVETYAPVVAGVLAWLLLADVAQARPRLYWAAAGLLGALIPLHYSILFLLPALYVLGSSGGGGGIRRATRALAATIGALCVALAILLALQVSPREFVACLRGNHLLAPLGRPVAASRAAYDLLSPAHAADLGNLALLSSPALLLAAPYFWWRRRELPRPRAWLLLAAIGPPGLMALINLEIGAFRDWDLFAWASVPASVLAGALARHLLAMRAGAWRALIAITGAAGMHLLLWMAVNADAGASERRFATLLRESRLSQHARAYGWESLGTHHRRAGRVQAALGAYEAAAAADCDNPRYLTLAGLRHAELGDTARALDRLRRAAQLAPRSHPENAYNLGVILLRGGRPDSAAAWFGRALTISPGFVDAARQLAAARIALGDASGALAALERVIASGDSAAAVHGRAASLAMDAGDLARAWHHASAALRLDPTDAWSRVVAGEVLARRGDDEAAIAQWELAAPRFPERAWLEARIAAARSRLGEARRLAPLTPR